MLDTYCTFRAIERVKLLKRCLFNFLVGNEDMHLKNHSLITLDSKVELAPAYDYVNSTVAFLKLGKQIESIAEVALRLRGRTRGLTRKTWVAYFGKERLGIPEMVINRVERSWLPPSRPARANRLVLPACRPEESLPRITRPATRRSRSRPPRRPADCVAV